MQVFFKRTPSNASSEISNIFKMGKKKDYLSYLNLLYTDVFYEKSKSGNITKMFFDNHKFDWELYIMLTLDNMGLDIYPTVLNVDYTKSGSYIEFDTANLTPLREVFEKSNLNFHLIINELLSFIRYIRMKKVIIGNLHIDSMHINLSTMKFYILDLSSTTFADTACTDLNLQSLYISLREAEEVKDKVIKYFDQEMELFNKNLSKYSYTSSLLDLYTNKP
jgi:hypothetical protein